MIIEYGDIEPIERYKLMSNCVVPRPIAWIVTEANGTVNVAPFSYFTPLSSNPPTLIVSIGHKPDGTPKDTLKNIRKTKRCTISMVAPKQLEQMHFSSKVLEYGRSEAKEFGIELVSIDEAYPPVIKGSPTAFLCDFSGEVTLKGSKTIPLLLSVNRQFVADENVSKDGKVVCNTLGRVGARYITSFEFVDAPKIP